jgi:hypothetical protein
MSGGVSSLNVSAAGAVVLFEAFRQRRNAARNVKGVGPHTGGAAEGGIGPTAGGKPKKQKGLGS